jgi:hypothetical protein
VFDDRSICGPGRLPASGSAYEPSTVKLSGDGLGCRAGLRLVPGGEGRGFDSRGSAGEGAAELLSVFGSEPPEDRQVIETIVPR